MGIDPKNAISWFNHSLILEKLEVYEKAIESYDNTIKIDPNDIQSLFKKGLILKKL